MTRFKTVSGVVTSTASSLAWRFTAEGAKYTILKGNMKTCLCDDFRRHRLAEQFCCTLAVTDYRRAGDIENNATLHQCDEHNRLNLPIYGTFAYRWRKSDWQPSFCVCQLHAFISQSPRLTSSILELPTANFLPVRKTLQCIDRTKSNSWWRWEQPT